MVIYSRTIDLRIVNHTKINNLIEILLSIWTRTTLPIFVRCFIKKKEHFYIHTEGFCLFIFSKQEKDLRGALEEGLTISCSKLLYIKLICLSFVKTSDLVRTSVHPSLKPLNPFSLRETFISMINHPLLEPLYTTCIFYDFYVTPVSLFIQSVKVNSEPPSRSDVTYFLNHNKDSLLVLSLTLFEFKLSVKKYHVTSNMSLEY